MTGAHRQKRTNSGAQRGQAGVEFACAAMVFFIVVVGIFDMARLFQSWLTVQHAAREGARYAITGRTDCEGASGRDACIERVAKARTHGLSGGGLNGQNVSVSLRAWDYEDYGAPIPGKAGKACDQIEVKVTYQHQIAAPLIKLIVPSGISISGSQRMTNEPFGICVTSDGVG